MFVERAIKILKQYKSDLDSTTWSGTWNHTLEMLTSSKQAIMFFTIVFSTRAFFFIE